ncbi:SDR family NAD(P)-dependent oxidoreductase [Bradyrhizobium sp. NP1]|uniref:SDR family NAD(P)-dependent oxidoreductase n=1 Tax=Bradyrhizobium sp. NP1 TaxID=3049772 RepID=UPI0025A551FE|nr:SDR family NAD(P)-dependent oxidoreductase [Bradyrhizobium sp. NP1]WJR76619.1 SDR family NAD(P)-dependent oxidoreductase [Bradyrhizobium sp. NP1]
MTGRLAGKSAIITGGAGGIGSATARLFAEQGARVALVDHDGEACEAAARAIHDDVPDADLLALTADVSSEAEAIATVKKVVSAWGALHVLVNNAGVREYLALDAATPESWQRIIGVNLLGAAYFAKAALPNMRRAGGASIVNISSTYGVNGRAGMGQYDCTKAALLSFTRTLAFEEVAHGIRVNSICPGYIVTPFHTRRFATSEAKLKAQPIEFCLMRRWADPKEIAYPVLWLASDEASYITGTEIMVDGGRPVI